MLQYFSTGLARRGVQVTFGTSGYVPIPPPEDPPIRVRESTDFPKLRAE